MIAAWRYRVNWLGKLILQVGERALSFYGTPYLTWRDATTKDISRTLAEQITKGNK